MNRTSRVGRIVRLLSLATIGAAGLALVEGRAGADVCGAVDVLLVTMGPDSAAAAPEPAVAPPLLQTAARAATEPPQQEVPGGRPGVAEVARASRSLPAPNSSSEGSETAWRFGVQAGPGIWLHSSAGDGGPFFPTARLEVLTAPLRGRWSAWGAFNLQGGWTAVGLSVGIVRRFDLHPAWWAAEVGAGAGFLVGERPYVLQSPGGPRRASRMSILPVVPAIATLAFTHSSLGEAVMTVGVNESLGWPQWINRPDVTVTWGFRMRL